MFAVAHFALHNEALFQRRLRGRPGTAVFSSPCKLLRPVWWHGLGGAALFPGIQVQRGEQSSTWLSRESRHRCSAEETRLRKRLGLSRIACVSGTLPHQVVSSAGT